jgi:hypothetical protein
VSEHFPAGFSEKSSKNTGYEKLQKLEKVRRGARNTEKIPQKSGAEKIVRIP